MKSTLDRIESRLQSLIETRLPWLRGKGRSDDLVHSLVKALQSNMHHSPAGYLTSADSYTVHVNPSQLTAWQGHTELIDQMVATLEAAANEYGVIFEHPISLRFVANNEVERNGSQIDATYSRERIEDTASIEVNHSAEAEEPVSLNAYLIVNGSKVYPLSQKVVNIGRRSDNHLVIDDPRISRSHAQIRNIGRTFVLFDLNSTGGTFVNNDRITQSELQPGDVISLAGLQLIYGEDTTAPASPKRGSTSEFTP